MGRGVRERGEVIEREGGQKERGSHRERGVTEIEGGQREWGFRERERE